MKIEQIISEREYHAKWYSHPVVHEWEDELKSYFNVRLNCLPKPKNRYLSWLHKLTLILFKKKSLIFLMNLKSLSPRVYNWRNIIPCVIDFWARTEKELENFYNDFSRNPVVLISSMEVFEYLKSAGCPLNIRHWGLSISDKYITPPLYFR